MKNYLIIISIALSTPCFGQHNRLDSLTTILEAVYKTDQAPRRKLDSLLKKSNFNIEVANQSAIINHQDSINVALVSSIIDKHGWLGITETSDNANAALFLVIQHADPKTREKYLPIMKAAVSQGRASPKDYAYLVDRTNMNQGKFQIYGSQLIDKSFYPIEDEPRVNERRKSVGLGTIEEVYARTFNVDYVLPKTDLLKNKIVIMGNIGDTKQNNLDSVAIYWGNNKLIGHTNKSGDFKIIVDKAFVHWALIFRKFGYMSAAAPLDNGRNVFMLNYRLNSKL